MLCLNCGKDIPIYGNVCPWCGTNKQQSTIANAMMLIFALIGGCIGAFLGDQVDKEMGLLAGGFIGAVMGGLVGFFQGSKPVTQNVNCPSCGVLLTVNRMEGPNFTCYKCHQTFHLQ